jgi:hypothetical protein
MVDKQRGEVHGVPMRGKTQRVQLLKPVVKTTRHREGGPAWQATYFRQVRVCAHAEQGGHHVMKLLLNRVRQQRHGVKRVAVGEAQVWTRAPVHERGYDFEVVASHGGEQRVGLPVAYLKK